MIADTVILLTVGVIAGALITLIIQHFYTSAKAFTTGELLAITNEVNAAVARGDQYASALKVEWSQVAATGKLDYSNMSAELRTIITMIKTI